MLSISAERIVPESAASEDARLMYLRHLFAYEEAARRLPSGTLVLDIGCGEGYGTAVLGRSTGKAVGIDVDQRCIEHATIKHSHATCRFQVFDGVHIPFPSGSFDAAVSLQVVEHVTDDSRFTAEIARVVRPGGMGILTTPNRLLRLSPGERPWNRYHVREYDADGLRGILAAHFSHVEVMGIAGDPEAQEHELERLAWVRRTASKDLLGLRRVLPEGFKRAILLLLRGYKARPSTLVGGWTTSRYRLVAETDRALDLFAACTR